VNIWAWQFGIFVTFYFVNCRASDYFRREKRSSVPCFLNETWSWIAAVNFVIFQKVRRDFCIFLPRCMKCQRRPATRKVSVRPSVCLSVKHVICDKTKETCDNTYTTWKIIYPNFMTRRMVGGGDPFYLKFWVSCMWGRNTRSKSFFFAPYWCT